MRRSNHLLIIIAVLMVAAVTLSCGVEGTSRGENNGAQTGGDDSCNATPFLSVSSTITRQETNQFGTQLCDYQLEIENGHLVTPIYIFIYLYDADGYAHTEEFRWMGIKHLASGETGNWDGYVYTYSDPDASGPVLSVPMSIAGVLDEPQCTDKRQDLDYLESISIPLDLVCPME
jgi:hypothetical protein